MWRWRAIPIVSIRHRKRPRQSGPSPLVHHAGTWNPVRLTDRESQTLDSNRHGRNMKLPVIVVATVFLGAASTSTGAQVKTYANIFDYCAAVGTQDDIDLANSITGALPIKQAMARPIRKLSELPRAFRHSFGAARTAKCWFVRNMVVTKNIAAVPT